MKKLLVVLAVFAFVLSGLAFATDSRIAGLGIPSWMTLDDDSIVFGFVGQLNNYKNLALLELSGASTGFGGATIDLAGNALGIYAGTPIATPALFQEVNGFLGSLPSNNLASTATIGGSLYDVRDTAGTPDNQILALYGIGLEGMNIGIGLGYSADSMSSANKTTYQEKDEISGSQSEINVLLGASLIGDIGIDAGISIALPSSTNKVVDQRWDIPSNASKEDNQDLVEASGMEIGGGVRAVLNDDLIALLGFVMESGKLTGKFKKDGGDDGDWEDENEGDLNRELSGEKSSMTINVGAAKLIKIKNVNVTSGLTFEYTNSTDKNDIVKDKINSANDKKGIEITSSGIGAALVIGAEVKLNETWSARAGASKEIFATSSITSKDLDNLTETTSSSDITSSPVITMGASCVVGNLTIDGVISQALLFNGPQFIGGGTPPPNMATQISVKYNW